MEEQSEEESASKRPRTMRCFRSCCQMLVRNVVRVCDEEKDLGVPHYGLNRARERAQDYLGIGRMSIVRLIDPATSLPEPGEGTVGCL